MPCPAPPGPSPRLAAESLPQTNLSPPEPRPAAGQVPASPRRPYHRYNPRLAQAAVKQAAKRERLAANGCKGAASQTNCFPRKTNWFLKICPPRPKVRPQSKSYSQLAKSFQWKAIALKKESK